MKMEVSYQNYWKFERAALDIGHKGMGSSYKHKKYSILTPTFLHIIGIPVENPRPVASL
jgi:hypothetical protein